MGGVTFLGVKFWPKGIFWSMKDIRIFWVAKKIEGVFGVAKKALRDFFGYVKKSGDFFG